VIDFSYQYNIFGVDPLPPSPENRLGTVWLDSVSIESNQRKYKLFRHNSKGESRSFHSISDPATSLLPHQAQTELQKVEAAGNPGLYVVPLLLFVMGCAFVVFWNKSRV